MTATAKRLGISVEDYLRGERESEVKHEYVNGEVYAMVGTTVAHNKISINLTVWLYSRVQPPCDVLSNEVKVFIESDFDRRFFYPDVMVACDGPDQDPYYRQQPCLVAEVLSESTERRDRSDKFFAYRRLESLQEYLLIAQDTVRVEVYRRRTGWDLEVYGRGERFLLDCAGAEMAVDGLYRGAEPPEPEPPLF